jgi:probable phosphoglycerate mutase
MGELTHLYLIRHGEAVVNVEPIVGDMRGDRGLTPLGVAQAERLRDRLAATGEIAADVLIASTLPRARQTAEIIAPALGLPIIWDDDVQELRSGEADGMCREEAYARYGRPNFDENPFRPVSPGGETWGQFMLRVGTALNRIARDHAGKTIVVVCHGGVIDGSLLCFFRLSTLTLPPVRFYTYNTSITHWDHDADEAPLRPWRLISYNDDTHLHDLDGKPIYWPGFSRDALRGADRPAVPLPTEERREP